MRIREDAARYKDVSYRNAVQEAVGSYEEALNYIYNMLDDIESGYGPTIDAWFKNRWSRQAGYDTDARRLTKHNKNAVLINEGLLEEARSILNEVEIWNWGNYNPEHFPPDFIEQIWERWRVEDLVENGAIDRLSPPAIAAEFDDIFRDVDGDAGIDENDGWGTYGDDFYGFSDPLRWYDQYEVSQYRPEHIEEKVFKDGFNYWVQRHYLTGHPTTHLSVSDENYLPYWVKEKGIDLSDYEPKALALMYLVDQRYLPDPFKRMSQLDYDERPTAQRDRTGWEHKDLDKLAAAFRKLRKA